MQWLATQLGHELPQENVETLLEFLGLVIGKAIFEGIVACQKSSTWSSFKLSIWHMACRSTFCILLQGAIAAISSDILSISINQSINQQIYRSICVFTYAHMRCGIFWILFLEKCDIVWRTTILGLLCVYLCIYTEIWHTHTHAYITHIPSHPLSPPPAEVVEPCFATFFLAKLLGKHNFYYDLQSLDPVAGFRSEDPKASQKG